MSIDNATPEEWDLAAHAVKYLIAPLDVARINSVLDRPFGEVPLGTRAYVFLLHQSGKVRVEMKMTNDNWARITGATWHPESHYRIAAVEKSKTKPSIDWSQVKPEYKWLARDADGEAYVFAMPPARCFEYWFISKCAQVDQLTTYTPGDCDWKDSLVERPAGS